MKAEKLSNLVNSKSYDFCLRFLPYCFGEDLAYVFSNRENGLNDLLKVIESTLKEINIKFNLDQSNLKELLDIQTELTKLMKDIAK